MTAIQHVELIIADKGIHCAGCEGRIKVALSRLPGVISVNADHRTQKVSVSLDTGKASLESVRRRLEQAGFTPAP